MIHVNGLIAYHVEVYHGGNWELALTCYPPYRVATEIRNWLIVKHRRLLIINPDEAEQAAYERAIRHADSIYRRDRVRVAQIKTHDMQPERTVVYERSGSIL